MPRTRNAIEVGQFVILLFLYIMVMSNRERQRRTDYTTWELVFDIYSAGWVRSSFSAIFILRQIRSNCTFDGPADFSPRFLTRLLRILEHGWKVYSQNLWSFLDTTFILIFAAYFAIRMHALTLPDEQKAILLSRTALDILSCGAPILVPRLAFNIMSENMLFVSLRAMMSDFLTLTLLAVWCFAGFLLSMKWLHNEAHSVRIHSWLKGIAG